MKNLIVEDIVKCTDADLLIGDKKTQTEIKGITNLNVWKDYFKNDKTPNINNGYPILNWQ